MKRMIPMPLQAQQAPFSHPDWLYEIKHDGFRALAYVEGGRCPLISRQGHQFPTFAGLCEAIPRELQADQAILDGELVCLNPKDGRAQFTELLHRRAEPYFYAFDLLSLNGDDLRGLRLIDRKRWPKAIMPDLPSRLLYVD